jgi:DNA modification methylase
MLKCAGVKYIIPKKWDTFSPDKARASKLFAIGHGDKGRKDAINSNLRGRRQSPAMSPSQIEYDRSLAGQREFQDWTERWAREVFRVLKPGGHILVCGAPRSYHRMACGLEGFEFIGIEREAEYVAIAERRVASVLPLFSMSQPR